MKKQWFDPQVTEISVKMTEYDVYRKVGSGDDLGYPEPGDHFEPCKNCICTS